MRVAHAGEHGAVQIYRAQRIGARWRAPGLMAELAEFQEHESGHRAIFAAELARRGRPRCRSYTLGAAGGWCLGLVTGLLGRGAIAVTTVAVERVVLRHLADYRRATAENDPEAHAALSRVIAEEQAHHDHFDAVPSGAPARLLGATVSGATEAVIRLGMRV